MKNIFDSVTCWGLQFHRSVEWIFLLVIASCFLIPHSFDHILKIAGVVGLLLNVLYSDLAARYLGACCENKPLEETRIWKISLQVVQSFIYFILLLCGVLFLSGT